MNIKMNLKCTIYKYRCGNCHESFESPVHTGSYGQFLLKNYDSNNLAWLDAVSDLTFQEVGTIIRLNPRIAILGKNKQSKLFQKIVGYAYDPDVTGNHFGIDAEPECPHCKKHNVLSYQEIVPPKYKNLDIPIITSKNWALLSINKKQQLLDEKLSDLLKKN